MSGGGDTAPMAGEVGRSTDSAGIFAVEEGSSPLARGATAVLHHVVMLFVCFISLAPLYAMLVTALKTTAEFEASFGSLSLPQDVTFVKFVEAWTGLQFSRLTWNSSVLSICSAILVTGIAAPAGFALARIRIPGSRFFVAGFIALMAVPAIVMILPLFRMFSEVGLINEYPSAIIAEVGINLPFGVFLTYTFMRDIPGELFKAAEVDGASWLHQFIHIAVPLSRPILATVALVTGIYAWNDLLVPLILWQSNSLQTLMVGLANLAPGRAGAVDIPLVMAGVCISVVPIIILFLFMQRALVRGLVEGSLK